MADVRIGVVGVTGHMGRMVARQVAATEGCLLSAGSERSGSAAIGRTVEAVCGIEGVDVVIADDAAAVFAASDAVIDFTVPAASVVHASLAAATGKALVVGTTGLEKEQETVLAEAAGKTPIVYAPNMSLGVNLLFDLVRRVAAALDPAYDIEIVEMHHRRKIDAPSGTALGLGRAAAAGRGVSLEAMGVLSREGITGPRQPGQIGFATLRGGEVVGDHTVIFAGPGERIELTHKAAGREIFAAGAVRAARWAVGRKPGLYTMSDVLGL